MKNIKNTLAVQRGCYWRGGRHAYAIVIPPASPVAAWSFSADVTDSSYSRFPIKLLTGREAQPNRVATEEPKGRIPLEANEAGWSPADYGQEVVLAQ